MKKVGIIGSTSALTSVLLEELSCVYDFRLYGRAKADVAYDVLFEEVDNKFEEDLDILIFNAALMRADQDKELLNMCEVNALGILKACMQSERNNKVHIIYISTIFTMLDENSEYYSFYAVTKKYGEELAKLYCRINDIKLTILRPSQIYYKDDRFQKSQALFYQIIQNASEGNDVCIFGGHDALRNFIYASDIAKVLEKVIEEKIYGEFSIINPQNIAISDVAKTAQRIWGKGGKISFLKDKKSISDNAFYDDKNLIEILNMNATSLECGIKQIMYYKEKGK